MKKNFFFLLICVLINAFFSNQQTPSFEVMIDITGGFYIKDDNTKPLCGEWYPSLFNPLLLVPTKDIDSGKELDEIREDIKFPFINNNKIIKLRIFEDVKFFKGDYQAALMKPISLYDIHCYFGLSPGINNYKNMKNEYNVLESLKKNNKIKEKIFSFDKWDITSKPPKFQFHLGESNNIFSSNEGIIGTCESYKNESLWGCSFKEMIFKNINIPLNFNNGSYNRIFFASEIHNIYFPNDYKIFFNDYTNKTCSCTKFNYVNCTNFFKNEDFVPLQLTEEHENFKITGQVDNLERFKTNAEDSDKEQARITFENIDYIILPLTVFKNFNIKFDAVKREISFQTDDPDILKVKEEDKKEPSSSSAGTVILIILIIVIVLALGYVAYRFLIKRKRGTETSINKFSKFEDEEDYHNLNEKKVF